MAKLSKRQKALAELVDRHANHGPQEGVDLVKKAATAKFDETIEAHFRLGINTRHADQQVRSTVVLPAGTGKTVRIAVITKGERIKEAEAAGADFVGAEEMIAKIEGGWMDFDLLVASPDIMGALGKLGKVLGPRGLMPSPKAGTVTTEIGKSVREFKAGKVEFRADKQGIVHVPVGKASFEAERLYSNLGALYDAINRSKPAAAKGTYIRSVFLTSTMGPSVRLDLQRLNELAGANK
ncbi:MAG: 50S ribosomal protein L1 [Candidatus Sericytochromatia bacterium]|nr:50S ribosomal protein L1 [Candidatus Sericytochromatia bacterium]